MATMRHTSWNKGHFWDLSGYQTPILFDARSYDLGYNFADENN